VSDAVQILVQGLTQGVVYALLAMGLAVVYRTSRVLNFAHGQILVVGTFVLYVLTTNPLRQIPYAAAALISLAVGAVLGLLVYLVAVKGSAPVAALVLVIMTTALLARGNGAWVWLIGAPIGIVAAVLLRGRFRSGFQGSIRWVLGTIAMATLLQEGLVALIGSTGEAVAVPGPFTGLGDLAVGGVFLSGEQLATAACAALLVTGFWLLESRTRYGRAMKAVAYSPDAAALMGIDVQRVVFSAFSLAAVSAVLAGLLVTPLVSPRPTDGPRYTLIALIAALLGGIESVRAAALGGLLLGVGEQVLREALSGFGEGRLLPLRDVVVYMLLIVILLVLPRGVFGSRQTERTT